jgi:sugar phosphate isomerase/epimerase
MQLSLTSWSLPQCTLRECVDIAKALGIETLDLGYFYRPALDKQRVLGSPEIYAQEVVKIVEKPASLYHLFGESLSDRNLANRSATAQNVADFKAVLRFCVGASIASVFVLPGVINPGQSRQDALDVSADGLRRIQDEVAQTNITLSVEPHVHSYLEGPEYVLELLARVPGLRLTLDYAHFHCLGYRQSEIDVLAPYATHVHLRQARVGLLQTKLEHGTLNFPAMLATLRSAAYSGFLALECVHQEYMNTQFEDVLSETVKLRDLVRNWFRLQTQ